LKGVSPAVSRKAQLWSIRAWGVYVGLQIMSLVSQWKNETSKSGKEDQNDDWATVKKRKQAIVCQLVTNVSRFPVICHWSVTGGIYNNELWTDVLSFISAVAAFSGGWESQKIPSPTF